MIVKLLIGSLTSVLIIVVGAWWAQSSVLGSKDLLKVKALPGVQSPPAERKKFKLITYNVGYGSGQANNLRLIPAEETRENLSKMRQFLSAEDCDFALLQEVDYRSRRSGWLDQAEFLGNGLFSFLGAAVNWDKNYVPYPEWPPQEHFGRMLSGQATLSRYPIENAERWVMEMPKENPFWHNAFYLDRLAVVTPVKIGTQTLILVNVHLEAFIVEARERQAKALRKMLEKWQDFPLIVAGDFNTEKVESTLSNLEDGGFLQRAAKVPKLTYPSWKPEVGLDHVLFNKKVAVDNCDLKEVPGNPSDHHPIIAEFRLL